MLKVVKEADRYVVSLFQVNKLNTLFSDLIDQQLSNLVSVPGREVIFNLEGIRFIDSAGFDTLLTAHKTAAEHGVQFKLCNISDEVAELLEITELKDRLPVCECESSKEKILLELDD